MQQPAPFFSICIPQHNRTSFLIAALETLTAQSFRDFEVCISDDASTDGREGDLQNFLDSSGLRYTYERQQKNLRYDGNLRAAIGLARGRYCFLLGNDDGLTTPRTLDDIAKAIRAHGYPAVALTNYRDADSGAEYRRVPETRIMGSGIEAAIAHFRSFSFVSGVILQREEAQRHATAKWDGGEMYQVYLVARTLASGAKLLGIADVAIDKDLQIPGESVDSYAAKPRLRPCPIIPRKLNLASFPSVVSDAISPYAEPNELQSYNTRILRQLYSYTYPYWLVEYRRVQSWKYALGVALGQRPAELSKGLELSILGRAKVRAAFTLSTLGGLLTPAFVSRRIAPLAYRIAKRGRA